MKKTISINIAGIIFYIEEDGYDKLGNYLKAIQLHFASYEGSKEIIHDIEARIAEKFWDKQKKENTQAITLDDVEELIASMGTVSDFEAIQEEEDLLAEESNTEKGSSSTYSENPQSEKSSNNGSQQAPYGPKKLFRDTKRKLLGGVCAGFAHYLGIDALWVRLIFLVLFIGLSPVTQSPLSGVIFVLYIASWIAFPSNFNIEDDDTIKKFYRNPDQKVLGGVVSGLASYTGFDLGMLRFIFVVMIFMFGSGIVIYLILWIIAPEAKTITDKMQMTGEPITLENIESNIKKTLSTENKPEDTLTKLLLLPFRLISQLVKAVGPIAAFFATIIRFSAGSIMLLTALATVLVLFFSLFVGITALENGHVFIGDDLPVGLIARDASPIMFIGGFLAAIVPTIMVGLAGISLITRRSLFTPVIWQSLFGIFFVGLFASMYTGVRYAKNFARTSSIENTITYNFGKKTPLLDSKNIDDNFRFETNLELIGYEGTELKLEKEIRAKGKDKKDAEKNALAITYSVVNKDSVLLFDNKFEFTENARFRDQRVKMKLYIPFEKPFSMTRQFAYFIENRVPNKYFDTDKNLFKGSLWQFNKNGELECLNRFPIEYSNDNNYDSFDDESDFSSSQFVQKLPLKGFEAIQTDLVGVTTLVVKQGENYKVEVAGTQQFVEQIKAEVVNNRLKISSKNKNNSQSVLEIHITVPRLTDLAILEGVGTTSLKDFDGDRLSIEMRGNNQIKLSGRTNQLQVKGFGITHLEAFDLEADNAKIEVTDNARAEVKVNHNLEAKAKQVAQIRYKGDALVQKTLADNGIITKANDE